MSRINAAGLLEPNDRFVAARLYEMHNSNPPIPVGNLAIVGAEPDSLLYERDCFVH
jgi:hypothetical protein